VEQILPRLYVGDDDAYKRVAKHSGWSWLRCCKNGPGGHRDTLGYDTQGAPKGKDYLSVRRGNLMALNMIDLDDPAYFAEAMVQTGLDFINERWKAGDKVLVACNSGHSRGPTTMLMYLRSIGEMPHSFVRSEKIYRTLYRKYDPGQGIRQYARSHWGQLEGIENA
jgi:hypothetical protein